MTRSGLLASPAFGLLGTPPGQRDSARPVWWRCFHRTTACRTNPDTTASRRNWEETSRPRRIGHLSTPCAPKAFPGTEISASARRSCPTSCGRCCAIPPFRGGTFAWRSKWRPASATGTDPPGGNSHYHPTERVLDTPSSIWAMPTR